MEPKAKPTDSVCFSTSDVRPRERDEALRSLRQRGVMTVEPLADHIPHAAIRKRFMPGVDILSGTLSGLPDRRQATRTVRASQRRDARVWAGLQQPAAGPQVGRPARLHRRQHGNGLIHSGRRGILRGESLRFGVPRRWPALSRHAALKRWSGRQMVEDLAAQGILIRSPSSRGVAEEAPGAYKGVGESSRRPKRPASRRVARLRPLICIKG